MSPPDRPPTRTEFSAQLASFDAGVLGFLTLVTEAVKRATDALQSGDRTEADRMAEETASLQALLSAVEREVEVAFALQTPVDTDLRLMLTVLRVVPRLERGAELARHIAERVHVADQLPADALASLGHMGRVATAMWERTTAAWHDRDASAAAELDGTDDELDLLSDEIAHQLEQMEDNLPVAMETRLVIRFYERLGDQAVRVADRIAYLATGLEP